MWHIRAQQVVLATGAHERPLVFADNDRPGVMLASAVRSYLNRYAVAAGPRVVVATTNDSAYDTGRRPARRRRRGRRRRRRPRRSSPQRRRGRREAGIRVLTGSAVVDTDRRRPRPARRHGQRHRRRRRTHRRTSSEIACDLLAVSGGWSPVVHLHSQRQGKLRWDDDLAGFVPEHRGPRPADRRRRPRQLRPRGLPGRGHLGRRRRSRRRGRLRARRRRTGRLRRRRAGRRGPTRPLWLVPGRTATAGGLAPPLRGPPARPDRGRRAAGPPAPACAAWSTSSATPRSAPPTTRARPPAVNAIGVIAAALHRPAALGHRRDRHHHLPRAVHAGGLRGAGRPPARRALRPRPADLRSTRGTSPTGALFEDVGQWKRPWYYPQAGEDMDAAVLRECAAVRDPWASWTPPRWARSRSAARTPASS